MLVRTSKAKVEARRRHSSRRRIAAAMVGLAASAVALFCGAQILNRRPQHTSSLTGHMYMEELLHGHSGTFYDLMGMPKHCFLLLLSELKIYGGLKESRGVTSREKLGIFLYTCRSGSTFRFVRNRFQHSSSTISSAFHQVLDAVVAPTFYRRHVQLPDPNVVPPEIRNNPRFFPFFKDAICTVDGSHFAQFCSASDTAKNRNRKGFVSQNVLACVLFNMLFAYILPGWEGSAADSRIWNYARGVDLRIPLDKYYLGDAGFPSCDALLVPYRGVRYHLKEWLQSNQRPRNYQELFNLRHASLRNVVERTFGTLKRKFPLPASAPEFNQETQAKIVCAVGAIFCVIRKYAPDTLQLELDELENLDMLTSDEAFLAATTAEHLFAAPETEGELHDDITAEEKARADARRDNIAKEMWNDYVQVLRDRGVVVG